MVAPILSGIYSSVTRGHNTKLHKFRSKYAIRKFYFSSSVITIWNSLPIHVIHAKSVNSFKTNLTDLINQDIICQAELHRSGSASEVLLA